MVIVLVGVLVAVAKDRCKRIIGEREERRKEQVEEKSEGAEEMKTRRRKKMGEGT